MENKEWDYNLYIGFIQMLDFWLNIAQVSNDQLFKELQKEEQLLGEQNEKYLKKILQNQEKIIKLLEEK